MSEFTAVGPAEAHDGLRPLRPRHSLLETEGVVVSEDATRVLNGVNVWMYPTGCSDLWEPCSSSSGTGRSASRTQTPRNSTSASTPSWSTRRSPAPRSRWAGESERRSSSTGQRQSSTPRSQAGSRGRWRTVCRDRAIPSSVTGTCRSSPGSASLSGRGALVSRGSDR